MKKIKNAQELTKLLEKRLRSRLSSVFKSYGLSVDSQITPLKWKPLVLVIGNYSSGKSTFINELLGQEVQRTGQAPTDDSFTIITSPEPGEPAKPVPGNTVVNDDRFPFGGLKRFGESLHAHVVLKRVEADILREVAIIDTPGMLDSVTEKDRGYDYLGVVSELARLADVILLMFDPHKAGTIKETYQAIRSTLPDATGEDRVVYVLNRIDECESAGDLVNSYGTLCWNLSQMTGRKDMPRIYLTYAAMDEEVPPVGVSAWKNERDELKKAVWDAPKMRLSHILQDVERSLRELSLKAEALASFKKRAADSMNGAVKYGLLGALLVFFFGDLLARLSLGAPETVLLRSLLDGSATPNQVLLPALGALAVLFGALFVMKRFLFPASLRRSLKQLDSLVVLDSTYKRDLWARVRPQVRELLEKQPGVQFRKTHARNHRALERFLDLELRRFFEMIRFG